MLIFCGLILLIAILVNVTPVQNFLARRAIVILSEKLDTKVSLKHIRVDFFNHVLIEGLYIEDQSQDTLLYAGEARVRVSDWFFLKKEKPVLKFIGLRNAYAHLYRPRTSEDWNYKFIIDAFDTGPRDKTKKQNEFEIDLEKLDLENVRFYMDDEWVGSDMDITVGKFQADADDIDLKKRLINILSLRGEGVKFVIREYPGGRPPKPRKPKTIDTTAFNTGGWKIAVNNFHLEDCYFSRDADSRTPTPREFDPEHIQVSNINADADDIRIVGDTLWGKMNNLTAQDRCGIRIKELRTDVTVSPNATICDNLYLETNNSKLQRYYAMHYERFPDFQEYVDKVIMVADMRDVIVDANDVAYFAPALRRFQTVVRASGQVGGTVDSLVGKNLNINDGNMLVKGNLKMIGLPDINTTWIDYDNGVIMTSGAAIMKYAPQLRGNPNIALERISHAYFRGNFTGYIENFAANGILTTNLGTIRSNVKMYLPGFQNSRAVYSGTVAADNFNLGALLRREDIGSFSFTSDIRGNAFDPKVAKVQIDAKFTKLEYRGYPYRGIEAKGTLEKNRFIGDVLIDDPNLAMTFNGNIDFNNKHLALNAESHILYSNLTALNLAKDSITLSADFDLNAIGNSIDDFEGYAKLYNVTLIRNNHHLDLDSIYVNSTIGGIEPIVNTSADTGAVPDVNMPMASATQRTLIIESNALRAAIKGDFVLSDIPNSVQYFVSKYLPNYINTPKSLPARQNLNFDVYTKQVDSLLGVVIPDVKGFNDAHIKGALNTERQILILNVDVPFGSIGNVKMHNIRISSDGNTRILGINAEADRVTIGDSLINGSVSVTTTVGNDSLLYNIATYSQGDYGTATINGRAHAKGDSLFFTLMPSEFYLGKNKWEINGGSRITLSRDYLYIGGLNMMSGLQIISADTKPEGNTEQLVITARNLDISQLGALAGIAAYQPEGRINGTIKIRDILRKQMLLTSDLKATNVRLGTDTLGSIIVAGSYEAAQNRINLNPTSGIYKGNASIVTSGTVIMFDSTSTQKVNGNIQFNNTPVSWITPLVVGYVSNLEGVLNGNVKIGGSPSLPDIDGKVELSDAKVRVDFLGTTYRIPKANVTVNNKEIGLGNITLYDAYDNRAIMAGRLRHDRFSDIVLSINMGSSKFEVINLKEFENEYFYGNLIAGFQNLSVTGPVEDLNIRITKARPADKSHLYLPIGNTTTGPSSYNYVSFKAYGTEQSTGPKKTKNKLNISIDAILNTLAEITLVLDPTTGDAINATGTGNLSMEIPMNSDIRMYGLYDIEEGDYVFTLKQLFFKRRFELNEGSRITFNGPIGQTEMNVEGVYTVRTRLYDLLSDREKQSIANDPRESAETKAPQNVNVLLYMRGSLDEPKLSFKLDLPDKRASGTLAYSKLEQYNQSVTSIYNQVASLLLIGSFIPEEGDQTNLGANATAGAISNVSEMFSGTASSQITNIISKLTGDKDISFNLKYKTYSYDNQGGNDLRNQLNFGFTKNLFNDRLALDIGSSLDWGRPTANAAKSNFNPVGDFRLQYQFKEGGNLRGYLFRTANYDVLVSNNITRSGIGISWRKSFDNLEEFFRGAAYAKKKLQEQAAIDSANSVTYPSGTW